MNRGTSPGDIACFVGSGYLATVVAEIIPSYPETIVVGGPSFGAAGRLVSLDLWVIEKGRTSFSGGEIEAVGTGCFVGSRFPATVAAEVIPSSPKTMVGGGPCFGAAGRIVLLDVRVIEEGQTSFLGGEIEALEGGKDASVCISLEGAKGRAPVSEITGGLGGNCRAVDRSE